MFQACNTPPSSRETVGLATLYYTLKRTCETVGLRLKRKLMLYLVVIVRQI